MTTPLTYDSFVTDLTIWNEPPSNRNLENVEFIKAIASTQILYLPSDEWHETLKKLKQISQRRNHVDRVNQRMPLQVFVDAFDANHIPENDKTMSILNEIMDNMNMRRDLTQIDLVFKLETPEKYFLRSVLTSASLLEKPILIRAIMNHPKFEASMFHPYKPFYTKHPELINSRSYYMPRWNILHAMIYYNYDFDETTLEKIKDIPFTEKECDSIYRILLSKADDSVYDVIDLPESFQTRRNMYMREIGYTRIKHRQMNMSIFALAAMERQEKGIKSILSNDAVSGMVLRASWTDVEQTLLAPVDERIVPRTQTEGKPLLQFLLDLSDFYIASILLHIAPSHRFLEEAELGNTKQTAMEYIYRLSSQVYFDRLFRNTMNNSFNYLVSAILRRRERTLSRLDIRNNQFQSLLHSHEYKLTHTILVKKNYVIRTHEDAMHALEAFRQSLYSAPVNVVQDEQIRKPLVQAIIADHDHELPDQVLERVQIAAIQTGNFYTAQELRPSHPLDAENYLVDMAYIVQKYPHLRNVRDLDGQWTGDVKKRPYLVHFVPTNLPQELVRACIQKKLWLFLHDWIRYDRNAIKHFVDRNDLILNETNVELMLYEVIRQNDTENKIYMKLLRHIIDSLDSVIYPNEDGIDRFPEDTFFHQAIRSNNAAALELLMPSYEKWSMQHAYVFGTTAPQLLSERIHTVSFHDWSRMFHLMTEYDSDENAIRSSMVSHLPVGDTLHRHLFPELFEYNPTERMNKVMYPIEIDFVQSIATLSTDMLFEQWNIVLSADHDIHGIWEMVWRELLFRKEPVSKEFILALMHEHARRDNVSMTSLNTSSEHTLFDACILAQTHGNPTMIQTCFDILEYLGKEHYPDWRFLTLLEHPQLSNQAPTNAVFTVVENPNVGVHALIDYLADATPETMTTVWNTQIRRGFWHRVRVLEDTFDLTTVITMDSIAKYQANTRIASFEEIEAARYYIDQQTMMMGYHWRQHLVQALDETNTFTAALFLQKLNLTLDTKLTRRWISELVWSIPTQPFQSEMYRYLLWLLEKAEIPRLNMSELIIRTLLRHLYRITRSSGPEDHAMVFSIDRFLFSETYLKLSRVPYALNLLDFYNQLWNLLHRSTLASKRKWKFVYQVVQRAANARSGPEPANETLLDAFKDSTVTISSYQFPSVDDDDEEESDADSVATEDVNPV